MIRLALLCAAALSASACVGPRIIGARPAAPAWLDERVAQAEAEQTRPAEPQKVPQRPPANAPAANYDREIAELKELRDRILTDPAFENPDADVDAAALTAQSRARAEREAQRGAEDN